MKIDCVQLRQLVGDLVADELDAVEADAVAAHLADCPACRKVVREQMVQHLGLLDLAGESMAEALAARTWAAVDEAALTSHAGVPSPSRPGPPAQGTFFPWLRPQLPMAGAAAMLLLISGVAALFWVWRSGGEPGEERAISVADSGHVAPPGDSEYVATLVATHNCRWEGANFPQAVEGPRLAPGLLNLRGGLAEIRFDCGARLLIEGPSRLKVESADVATLMQGKAVFRGNATSEGFELRTGAPVLYNSGTEYGVLVDEARTTEVHVFEGDVQSIARDGGQPHQISAIRPGEGCRYVSGKLKTASRIRANAKLFVREMPVADPVERETAPLLAYDGFDYQAPTLEDVNGGFGWASPWLWKPRMGGRFDPPFRLNAAFSLTDPKDRFESTGGTIEHMGDGFAERHLATPLCMDADETYYISFLFETARKDDHTPYAAIELRDSRHDELPRRLMIGIFNLNSVFVRHENAGRRAALPLRSGSTYRLIVKIAARRDQPDQAMVSVIAPDSPPEIEHNGHWSVIGPAVESDLVFDRLQLRCGGECRYSMIDEIRIGTTWDSVVNATPHRQMAQEK